MGKTEYCKVLTTKKLNRADLALFRKRIDQLYSVNMIVDNLPGATEIPPALSGEEDNIFYETGASWRAWRIGGKIVERCWRKYYLHNHYKYEDRIHKPEKNMFSDTITTDDARLVSQCGKQKIR